MYLLVYDVECYSGYLCVKNYEVIVVLLVVKGFGYCVCEFVVVLGKF